MLQPSRRRRFRIRNGGKTWTILRVGAYLVVIRRSAWASFLRTNSRCPRFRFRSMMTTEISLFSQKHSSARELVSNAFASDAILTYSRLNCAIDSSVIRTPTGVFLLASRPDATKPGIDSRSQQRSRAVQPHDLNFPKMRQRAFSTKQ